MLEAIVPEDTICFKEVCVSAEKVTQDFKDSENLDNEAYSVHERMKRMVGFRLSRK